MPHHLSPPVAVLVACALIARGGDSNWPRFRGQNGAGISEAKGMPATWTDADYKWRAKLPGMGHSSPVVWGNRLFVTCGDPKTALRMLLCLDAATGETLWRRDFPAKPFRQHGDNAYASASPAADAHGVVISLSTPDEVALAALDNAGNEAWRRGLGPWIGNHGTGVSPIIEGGLVILANEQEDPRLIPSMYGANPSLPPGKSFVVALDRKTGETRWQAERVTKIAPYSTPCVAPSPDGRPELVLSSMAHGISALDLATGEPRWELGNLFRDRCVGSPVLALPADGGLPLAIASYGTGTSGALMVAVRAGSRTRGIEPRLAWQLKGPVPLVPTPIVKDGWLYLWFDNGTVACHKAETGELAWRDKLPAAFYGSPVWVDGRLYCISKAGEVFVVAASPDKFELLGRVPLGEPSFATPAVAGGILYLRTRTQVLALCGN